jgi:hypothetical protein
MFAAVLDLLATLARHMHRWMIVIALAAVACMDTPRAPILGDGDSCTAHGEQASCGGDPHCMWYQPPPQCPVEQPFCAGVCQWPPGVVTGDGTASAACACPTGGTCFEQFGGPARPAYPPAIQCVALSGSSSGGDACTSIAGQGRCTASATVHDLCLCDNGIR